MYFKPSVIFLLNYFIVPDLLNSRKMSTKKMQAHVTEFATKEPNLDPETVKKTKSTLLSIFYSNTKNTAHGVTDLKRLLSWKENPSDIVKETDHKEADIIDIFGPNMNMIELVKANGKVTMKF